MQHRLPCDHANTWRSHPPLPIGVQNGALVVTVMYCEACGYVEYRSPPIKQADEDALDERVKQVETKKKLMEPIDGRRIRH